MRFEPLPPYALAAAEHDRLVGMRSDDAAVETIWADPATRVLVLSNGRVGLAQDDDGRPRLLTVHPAAVAQLASPLRVLLGAVGEHRYTAIAETEPGDLAGIVEAADGRLEPLRAVAGSLPTIEAGLVVHALALATWHARHGFCAACGAPSVPAQAGAVRECPRCGTQHFPRIDPAVIMLVVDDDDRCLLGHNAARDETWYSTLAGFVDPGETLEAAVVREVAEETGVRIDEVHYAGSQPWPFPASLMLGFQAHATQTDIEVDGVEITRARWFTREELRSEVEAGQLVISTTVSISGALIASWFGGDLPVRRPMPPSG